MDWDQPEFWNARYEAGRMPWDMHGVPVALERFIAKVSSPGRVLIPGCGSGYEVRAFAKAGWDVVAMDFSEAAVARARAELGVLGDCVKCGDFFGEKFSGTFDLVYERTFLCSISPSRWNEYGSRVAASLRPGGLLAGVFFFGHDPDPPPFGLIDDSAKSLFGSRFILTEDEAIPAHESPPIYGGNERWQIWRLRQ